MTTEKTLAYRGDIKALTAVGGTVVLVTTHPENQPTAVYRLDAAKLTLAEDPLPAGAVALAVDGDTIWVAGSDARIYQCPANGGTPKALGQPLSGPAVALALANEGRLAVLHGSTISLLSRKDGRVAQTLELKDGGTALAADPTGRWLVAGTVKGTVSVFDGEDKAEFLLSESDRLHEGAVSALLFEPEELRFFSAGADQKLLSTLARGKLEPEDKGRGNNHSDVVTALVWGPGDRFFSGSRDKTIKSWPRTGAVRPATLKDGVVAVVGLAVVGLGHRSALVAACDDNTLRFFKIEESGKFGDATHRISDAYVGAENELGQNDARRREAALKELARYNDTRAIDLISEQVDSDADHGMRLLATQLLGDASHPRAAKLLEDRLTHSDEAVRVAALKGLRKHLGESDLHPLQMALRAAKIDIGRLAVQALEQLAARDDQALALLTRALNAKTLEIRQAALTSLEKVYDPQSPEANLVGLESKHADLRRFTLVRLMQRGMLQPSKVQAALRRRTEDEDAEVRRTAFLLSLYTRDRLLQALRTRDPELQRQLVELETFGQEPAQTEKKDEKKAKPIKGKEAKEPRAGKINLEETDYEPLLQATASRSLDTCLRGARGLAILGDARAFGLLLQLSREEDAQARAEVCRALAALDDPRSIKRLRSLLFDPDAAVRDAAFTALAQIHTEVPLQAADAGLSSSFEDVRRRGLQVLIAAIRPSPPRQADEPAWQLLVRTLNDSFESVRSEAFKASLNLKIAGGGVQTLRFVLQSIHADVRREVLTEVMAQANEAWAWNLLLEFYNDPDPQLRKEAFDFATKKDKELGPLEAALAVQYVDVRKMGVQGLIRKHTKAAQELLVRALAYQEKEVRQQALGALVHADAQPILAEALNNPHPDIRVKSAQALARHGAAAALAPLLTLASSPEPQEKERQKDWSELVEQALEGLGELGDAGALADVAPLLQSTHPGVRKMAARALAWLALPHHLETLRQALQHADPQVKYNAALGLAYAGDPLAASLVYSPQSSQVLSAQERLVAALTLGPAGEDQLVGFLDQDAPVLRDQALLLHMLLELQDRQAMPARCLACLSSRMPRVRLTAARGLECFADPAAFAAFVVELFNDNDDEQPWKVKPQTVEAVADLLAHGAVQTRARTAHLLRLLTEKSQAAWDQAWGMHADRHAAELSALREQARQRRPVPQQCTAAQLQELAFGAYVGLVREQGRGASAGAPAVRVRQTALSRIVALASADEHYRKAAIPVLVQALGDPNKDVRFQAFESLQALGMDSTALGAEALETGHIDLGVKGLELLTAQAGGAKGQAVLEEVMLTRKDDLALEAARLLTAQRGAVPVASKALTAVNETLRVRAVGWLAAEYDKDSNAKKLLRQALESRYQAVREAAAQELATKKDATAFDALVKMLTTAQDKAKQRHAIEALVRLGDARAAAAFLDRLENDPSGTAEAGALIHAAGNFRKPETADRLLGFMDKSDWRKPAFSAVRTIGGYDQRIEDPEDEQPDPKWLREQFPRHDALLARLMEKCFALGEPRQLQELLGGARWAKGHEVDPVLALLVNHPDERLRQEATMALGWRLRKRQAPADALLKGLHHKDSVTQFLAAEGLARGRRSEGLNVLLASVDYLSDLGMRTRAVSALGELGDVRALDTLLKFANEPGHALQDAAAEALGHLGRSEKGEEIFKLLERYGKGNDRLAERALKGLRWLNTHAGWQLIRKRADDEDFTYRSVAVELLGYNDDPATRDLLLRLLSSSEDHEVMEQGVISARRLWGKGSLEPDYALLQNSEIDMDMGIEESLKRVREKGEVSRIFEVLPRSRVEVQDVLATTLLNQPTLPVKEAQTAIASAAERTVAVAAHILGRAGTKAAGAGTAVQTALQEWRDLWEERRQKMVRENARGEGQVQQVTACLESLLWAAGRLGVAQDQLLSAARARGDDRLYRPVRLAAVSALASGPMAPAVLTTLSEAAVGADPEIRTLAAEAIGRHDAKRAAQLAEQLLSDRVSFDRLTAGKGVNVAGVLRTGASQVHYQGVALPHLIGQADLEGLGAVAGNRTLSEATRLGAIEALAKLAQEPAEAKLVQIGQNKQEDVELRKAAWRALRRSKRARQKATARAEVKA